MLTKFLHSKIITKGNEGEQNRCIEFFAQLSFDDEINKDIQKDTEFVTKVKEIVNNPSKVKYKSLLKSCEQLIWILEKDHNKPKVTTDKECKDEKDQHIMISYNRNSRELCLQIKQKLEEMGNRIWIDVDDMRGSTLDAMANAIDNARCVLMCVTENYRQSINCQAEAEYAFKNEKKIIPVIMQEGMGINEVEIISIYF